MAEGYNNVFLKKVDVTATTDAAGNFTPSLPSSLIFVSARAIREAPYYTNYYFCMFGKAMAGNTAITCVTTGSGQLELLANTDVKVEIWYYE